ncbi:hypothetical protein ACFPMF_15285 [Larkinella bovis]|uniref:Uncharacterized protein n=1 Tax=Larkinella bovis TaxID=683041 RepID=A0ABW0IDY9_9BACT
MIRIRTLISINKLGVPDFFIQPMPAVPRVGEKVDIGNFLDTAPDVYEDLLDQTTVDWIKGGIHEVKDVLWRADNEGYYAVLGFDRWDDLP